MSKSIFSELFNEETPAIKEVLENHISDDENVIEAPKGLPQIPPVETADEEETKNYWRLLRQFYRTAEGGGLEEDQLFPALLAPYRDVHQARKDYPFWITSHEEADKPFLSLTELIDDAINEFAPGKEEGTVLKKVIGGINGLADKKLDNTPVPFRPLIDEALDALVEQIEVTGTEGETFRDDIERLKIALPSGGMLVPFSGQVHLQLLSASLKVHLAKRRRTLREEVNKLKNKLSDVLTVEREKGDEAHDPEHLKSSFSSIDHYFDFKELSGVIPESGSVKMPDERLARITQVVKTLKESEETLFGQDALLVLPSNVHDDKAYDWKTLFPKAAIKKVKNAEGCTGVLSLFEAHIQAMTKVIVAIRIAHLELEDAYQPSVHSDYFEHFNWHSFSAEEIAFCPPVILIEDVETLVNNELSELSRLLASNSPVRIMAIKRDARTGFGNNGSDNSSSVIFRQELGAITISHRNVFVMQSTPVSPAVLCDGFVSGLGSFTPAVFYVLAPLQDTSRTIDSYLWTSASVESRGFPGVKYAYDKSPQWGGRFDISNNPQPQANWPVYNLKFKNSEGSEEEFSHPFTFADFASQDPLYLSKFKSVSPKFWTDNLVPIHELLSLSNEEIYAKVPYIWMTDKNNTLHKVAVAHEVAMMCMERLDFWHYIQENGGVKSFHVEKAMEEADAVRKAQTDKEIETLQEAHASELEKAKDETAGDTMEKLVSVLLDMDTSVLTSSISHTSPTTETIEGTDSDQEKQQAEPVNESPEEEKSMLASEAYVDTPLCTSCNECIDLNGKIFEYNADKMAFVANPKGGSFADIVAAAELCPVKVIHPGTPQDPNEPDLDNLVKRADEFN